MNELRNLFPTIRVEKINGKKNDHEGGFSSKLI